MELPVTVPEVQCTLIVMALPTWRRIHLPLFCLFVSVRFSREDFSFPRGAWRGRFCGEVYVGDRVEVRLKGHRDDQEQMGSVHVRSHVAAGTPYCDRLPVSFGMLLTGEILISRSGGESVVVVFMCLLLSCYPVFMCLCLN